MINLGAKLFCQLAVTSMQHFFNECKGDTTTTIIAILPLMSSLITLLNAAIQITKITYSCNDCNDFYLNSKK
jgi:hypothetical protein